MSTCDETHCITCSDEAVPMRVLELRADGIAVCADPSGARSDVMVDLVVAGRGDTVLVHAGVALQLAEPAEQVRP